MNIPIYIAKNNAKRSESDEIKAEKDETLYLVDETLGTVTFYQKTETIQAKIIHCNGAQRPKDTAGKKITHYPGMKFIAEEGTEEVFLENVTEFKP
jgi:hypothetical protein